MELLPFSNFLNYKFSLSLSQALQWPAVREGLLETAPGKAEALPTWHTEHTGSIEQSPRLLRHVRSATHSKWLEMPFLTPRYQPLLRNIQNPKSQQDPKPSSPQEVPLTWLPGQSGAPPAISGLKMALSQSNQTLTSHAWGPLLSGTSRPKRG